MAKRINVSIEELIEFADYVKSFSQNILDDCDELKSAFCKIEVTLDDETRGIFATFVRSIETTLSENADKLNEVEQSARQYAGVVKLLQEKMNSDQTNTAKKVVASGIMGAVMHEHIKATDSEYQTMDAYRRGKGISALKIANTVSEFVGLITNQSTPTLPDETIEFLSNANSLQDGEDFAKNPQKRINRSATDIPKDQIESHTLIIDDANEPYEKQ